MKVISLGWGVQSWGLAAMVAKGVLPPVDAAIHSDTTHERHETYAFAARWTPWLEEYGVRVVTVRAHDTRFYERPGMNGLGTPPVFTTHPNEPDGKLRRSCTQRWKIAPMRRWAGLAWIWSRSPASQRQSTQRAKRQGVDIHTIQQNAAMTRLIMAQ